MTYHEMIIVHPKKKTTKQKHTEIVIFWWESLPPPKKKISKISCSSWMAPEVAACLSGLGTLSVAWQLAVHLEAVQLY